jgi:hypothetical protein
MAFQLSSTVSLHITWHRLMPKFGNSVIGETGNRFEFSASDPREPAMDQRLNRPRRSKPRHQGGRRCHLARQFHDLRSRIHRLATENVADNRQPVRPEVATYVLGTSCYLCLRYGQSSRVITSAGSGWSRSAPTRPHAGDLNDDLAVLGPDVVRNSFRFGEKGPGGTGLEPDRLPSVRVDSLGRRILQHDLIVRRQAPSR